MSRPLRIEYEGAWYHVMNRGSRRNPIFLDKLDYENFVGILRETKEIWHMRVSAYCLMPNHYHLLVQTPEGNISRCMRHVNGLYTQRFNRRHHGDGPIFRGRYKAILVDAEGYLLQLVRYIHRNPLRAGIVDQLEKYPWTSHKGYLSSSENWAWLNKNQVLSMFSKKRLDAVLAYRQFVAGEDMEEISGVFGGKKYPLILGSESFVNEVKKKFFSAKFHEDIPDSRLLAPSAEDIGKVVSQFYGVGREELLVSRRGWNNEARNVAIYLTRRLRGSSLKEIAGQFQMNKYSSVSSVIERMKARMSKDRTLSRMVQKQMLLLVNKQEKIRPLSLQ